MSSMHIETPNISLDEVHFYAVYLMKILIVANYNDSDDSYEANLVLCDISRSFVYNNLLRISVTDTQRFLPVVVFVRIFTPEYAIILIV